METGNRNTNSIVKNLSKVYEDPDIVVYTAPNEDELKDILVSLLRANERMSIKDLHSHLSGLASEDKIRSALSDLMKKNRVMIDRDGYFYLVEPIEEYEADGTYNDYI
ncbi:MAG: mediator of RNA polymerase II transcription subunit 1 [Desulfurococcales archaeon]|nr:mediator of RNA polymerase II transcription subunit 1 [Desulfurococcales archaeon]